MDSNVVPGCRCVNCSNILTSNEDLPQHSVDIGSEVDIRNESESETESDQENESESEIHSREEYYISDTDSNC